MIYAKMFFVTDINQTVVAAPAVRCKERVNRRESAVRVVVVSRFGKVQLCFFIFLVAGEFLSNLLILCYFP